MATGVDNSGLYAGRREAMGIIKAMASEITSFDIFSGIGISAATAFASAAKSSYDFEKEFRKNMLEVATISTQVSGSMTDFMNQVMAITQEIPIKAPEAAKALYQIVSAGHDGAAGMKVLEVSAKSAVGGLTDTATAADAITTLINAYKMSADDAEKVSDQLFTTARLGKTTFGELGQSIAQVAPIAAAYGVEMDQVLAAVATLTKSGTPTAQAMTQIRASIIGTSKVLGDGAFNGRTFQEALEEIAQRAGGSESKLRELIPEVEAVNGVLGMTGLKAKTAAADLAEMNASAGATEAAFKKMQEDVDNQMILLSNNIQAALRPMGEAILKEVSEVARAFNEAFANGDVERSLIQIGNVAKIITGAFLSYKTAVILVTVAQNMQTKAIALNRLASIQHITTTQILTGVLKKQAAAMLAAGKAALFNPYILATAAVASLGYGLYKLATQATASEKALDAHNDRVKELKDWTSDTTSKTDELISVLRDENTQNLKKVEVYNELQKLYPEELKSMSLQEFLLLDVAKANDLLAKSIDNRALAQQRATVNSIEEEMSKNSSRISQLDKKSWIDTSLAEAIELRRLRNRNEQLKIEYDKSVEIVVQGLKDRTKAESLTNKSEENKPLKPEKPVDKKALEARKKLNEELLSLRMQNQQAEINLMAEGREKRLTQIEFDYDSEIAVILAKEKEWKEAQGGKLTEDQTKEIHVSFFNSYVKKEKSSALVDKDQLEAEKQAMNEYLAAYGNYQEKRKAITEKYNNLMAKATTEGEKLSLGKELTKSLSDLDIEANKTTSAISVLFDDMSKKTVEDLHAIADAGEKALQFLQNGQWDATTGANLGMSEETFKTLKDSPKELEAIIKAIVNMRAEADKCDNAFGQISGGLKKIFSSGGDTKKFQEGLAEVSEGMNSVMQAGQFLSDSLSELGNAFGNDTLTGIAEGVNVAMDAMGSAMDGAKAGAAFGPWGAAAGAAIGMVTSLASSFAKIHDAKNEKRIAVLQEQIETLDKSYDMLGDAIDKAYSKDASNLIDQQNKLLEQQKVLIRQQIREEEDKKKTDDDRIKEWREQLEEIDKTLADNKEKAVDAIFGEDLQSAIDNFAQAYADAWASGEDRAKSMKDVAKKMIQSTIVEMIKSSAGLGETVKKIREMITGYLADGVVSDWEQGQLDAYIESETAKLDGKYDWADKYMKEDKEFDLGITSDSIADTIAEGLADGKSGFKDFAGSFEDMMRTAVINSLKTKHLEGPLKEFQKKFSDMSESGGQLTEAEIEELRGMYADIIDGAKVQFDSLKDIAGLDFTADSDNSLKGAYAKASQESIDLLAGQTGAQRVIMEDIRNNMIPIREQMQAIREMNSKGWEDVKVIRELTVKIEKNSEQVATNTRMIHEVASRISENTRGTVDALEGTINVKIKGM